MLPRSQEIIQHFSEVYQKANKYRYTDQDKYTKMLNKLYAEEGKRRMLNLNDIGDDKRKIETVMEYCSVREHLVDWMVDWIWTYDPRNPAIGLPAYIPWIPWQRQIEFIEWFYKIYFNLKTKTGYVEKSRDAGATWLFVFLFVREWRWEEGFAGGIGSRKLTLVDDKENPKAVFQKMRQLMEKLPEWWYPEGFERKRHDKIANLINPENGSNIAGEGGDDIGRGDRRSVYLVDEAAFLEHPQMVDSALSQTTDTFFPLSTPNGMNYFGKERKSGRHEVFTFHWRQDARKDEIWYSEEKRRLNPVVLAQEVDIDYQASVEDLFIQPKHIEAAIDLDLPITGTRSSGLDVAAGGINKSALATKLGSRVYIQRWNYDNGIELAYRAIEESNKSYVEYMNYDAIGVGYAVKSTIEKTEMRMSFEAFGVLAGGETSDMFYPEFGSRAKDIFANAVTEWWYIVSVLFRNTYEFVEHGIQHDPAEMISIQNDGDLISQLSSVKKKYRPNGKMIRESKDEMKTRQIESPDDADALVMACIPQNAGIQRVWATFKDRHCMNITNKIKFKDLEPNQYQIYIVLIYDIEMGIYGNCFYWGRKSRVLRVYDEFHHPDPIAMLLGKDIRVKARVPLEKSEPKVTRIYGNDLMFKGGSDWNFNLRKKAKVRIYESKKFEESAATMLTRSMFMKNQIVIDKKLENTISQYRGWRILKRKPEKGYPYCRALNIAVTELRDRGELKLPETIKPYSKRKRVIREGLRSGQYQYPTKSRQNKLKEYDYLLK
jgi:hypothetical protein